MRVSRLESTHQVKKISEKKTTINFSRVKCFLLVTLYLCAIVVAVSTIHTRTFPFPLQHIVLIPLLFSIFLISTV